MPEKLIGDDSKIEQVMSNLIDNAIKFTDKGIIEINLNLVESSSDQVKLEFIVRDTGIGIPASKHKSIFDKFEQGEYYLTKKYAGAGLGLAICRQIVDSLGGAIRLESAEGIGTRFIFELGFKTVSGNSESGGMDSCVIAEQASYKDDHLFDRKYKALLVEDNEMNQQHIKLLLEKKMFLVDVAANGAIAVEMYRKNLYDIVLMDIQMPVMNGLDAAKEIRSVEKETGRYTSIIGVTAFAMRGDRERALESGMDDYIQKPIKMDEFYDKIKMALNK